MKRRQRFEVTIWIGDAPIGLQAFVATLPEVFALVDTYERMPEVKQISARQLRSDGRPMRYAFRSWHRDSSGELAIGWGAMPT